MNDADYRSTLECLRIAMRLITPLDLDGFVARAEELDKGGTGEHAAIQPLVRLARALKHDAHGRDTASPRSG